MDDNLYRMQIRNLVSFHESPALQTAAAAQAAAASVRVRREEDLRQAAELGQRKREAVAIKSSRPGVLSYEASSPRPSGRCGQRPQRRKSISLDSFSLESLRGTGDASVVTEIVAGSAPTPRRSRIEIQQPPTEPKPEEPIRHVEQPEAHERRVPQKSLEKEIDRMERKMQGIYCD